MQELGKNLKRIRLLNDLSLEKAGQLLHMSAPAILKYESGAITPNSEKLIAFANAYGVSVRELLKIYHTPLMKFDSFRKKQKLKGQNLELLKEIIQNEVSNYLEVVELNQSIPKDKLKKYKCLHMEDVEKIAYQFKKDYELSMNQPISDLIHILENLGILIIELENPNHRFDDFDGLSEIVQSHAIIVLLKEKDGARQRFTIAHELGHLILDIDKSLDKEKVCNQFAGALLMPSKAVIHEFGKSRSHISIYELEAFKQEYKVSMAAIIYRLKELNIISEYLFKKLNIFLSSHGLKKQELTIIPAETSYQFKKIVHKLEVDNIISFNRAIELLGVSVHDYNEENNNYRY